MTNDSSTIIALATPPGKSGVAVIRLSGPDALSALPALGVTLSPTPRHAHLVELKDGDLPIDQALLLYFPNPHSFTGEAVIELHCHGGRAIIERLIRLLTALPAIRAAEPGEFTRRAVENGKLDILQAEGLADLIEADTDAQRQQAIAQLGGNRSSLYNQLREKVIHALALFEAYIDFPDEPVPEAVVAQAQQDIQEIIHMINGLLDDQHQGEIIRDGVKVAIIGPPNAGKSSLLNWLAKRDVAIVSDIAGTTRDVLEVSLDLDGHLVRLYDTAGIRETDETIEAEGIRRAEAHAEDAHLLLVMLDSNSEQSISFREKRSDEAIHSSKQKWTAASASASSQNKKTVPSFQLPASLQKKPHLMLWNKCDLLLRHPEPKAKDLSRHTHQDSSSATPPQNDGFSENSLFISLKTGDGLDAFMASLTAQLQNHVSAESSIITRARHRDALTKARDYLSLTLTPKDLELTCEELRLAADQIGAVTGHITTDDLLDVIFSSFCIGK